MVQKQGPTQVLFAQQKEEVVKWALRMQNLGHVNHKNTIANEGQWNYPNSCDTFHKWCSKVEVFHVTPSI